TDGKGSASAATVTVRVAARYEVPDRPVLAQSYPNPFNPRTTIEFVLPEAVDVRLEVFDLVGRSIRLLIDERRDAGVHRVDFEASELASGVYLYRLVAGGTTQ